MKPEILLFCCCKRHELIVALFCICNSYPWMCTLSVSLRPEQKACEPLPPQIASFLLKLFVPWYHPPPPIGEPLTPLSHLRGVVIPSPIVFYLTEMYKFQHILLSGRPFSKHQLRGVSTPKINSRNLTSTLRSLLQLKRAHRFRHTHIHTHTSLSISLSLFLTHTHLSLSLSLYLSLYLSMST